MELTIVNILAVIGGLSVGCFLMVAAFCCLVMFARCGVNPDETRPRK